MGKIHKRRNRKIIENTEIPASFWEKLSLIVGPTHMDQIRATFRSKPSTFRVNTIKAKKEDVVKELTDLGFKFQEVPWCLGSYILENKSKREMVDLPMYQEGKIYMQSLASMVPPLMLDPRPGEMVLDLTAAPGSKTSQMAAIMKQEGTLIANDNSKIRFFKLKHNMELLGVVNDAKADWNFELRQEDGCDLCGDYINMFDKILVDAPCSAEARFLEDDAKTFSYWGEKKVKEMAMKQRKLLFSAWYALKPGGTLVYSTCTFSPEENEVQISRLLNRFPEEARIEEISGVLPGLKHFSGLKTWKERTFHPDITKALRIFPTQEVEGFFVAKIRKLENI